ncbi:MAG: hypothetical protein WBW44_02585, partial [Solirubrobacterales bacterium]
TDASNLDPEPDYYGAYVRNLNDNTTTLRSNDNDYAISLNISGDGSRVAWFEAGGFTPDSEPDVRGIFTRPTGGGAAEFASRPAGSAPVLLPGVGYVYPPGSGVSTISADGRFVTFDGAGSRLPGGSQQGQVFRRDLSTGEIELAARDSGGAAAIEFSQGASISSDGSRVAFSSYAKLVPEDVDSGADVYVRDFANGTTTLVSRANGVAGDPADAAVEASMISGDGNRVVFSTRAANFGLPGGDEQVYVRDILTNETILVSRNAGVEGDNDSSDPRISGDGQKVVFASRATNLDPADIAPNRDIFVRDLAANTTTLVSRMEGLGGATTPGTKYSPAISSDGNVVAFETEDQAIAPEGGVWPAFREQVVSRVLSTGANTLVSRAAGGTAAEKGAGRPSIDGDGSVIAFESSSTNLKAGLGGDSHDAVFIRDSVSGEISGPPAFGRPSNSQGSGSPAVSENGQCVHFTATGFNEASGDLSDLRGSYVNVVSGTCTDPRQDEHADPPPPPKPKLSKVKLTKKKFAVANKSTAKIAKKKKKSPKGTKVKFRVSENSSVTIKIEKKVTGRKVKGKCRKVTKKTRKKKKCSRFVNSGKLKRRGLQAGNHKVYFSGRIGKRKLKPGKYRVQLIAYNSAGASNKVRRPFRIVKR